MAGVCRGWQGRIAIRRVNVLITPANWRLPLPATRARSSVQAFASVVGMSESAGDRAELYWGFDRGEVDPGTQVEEVTRADIEDAVRVVAARGQGVIQVGDVLDDPQSLATMCEAWFRDGEWSLSYYFSETFTLDSVPAEKVVDVFWQFATADPAFREAGWAKRSDLFPFSMTTSTIAVDIAVADIPASGEGTLSAVPPEFGESLAEVEAEVTFYDERRLDAPSLSVGNAGEGFVLTLLGGGRRGLVVDDLEAAERVVASWFQDALQPPLEEWD